MTDRDRRRRAVLLCCSFARNLAYYRAGQDGRGRALLSSFYPQASFWRQANVNFLDVCVLEWCKLLGDKKAEHHWSRVVFDGAKFEAALLQHIGIDGPTFADEVKAMRLYRDKFVAHLDNLRVMNIPVLDAAKASVWFYHEEEWRASGVAFDEHAERLSRNQTATTRKALLAEFGRCGSNQGVELGACRINDYAVSKQIRDRL